MQSSIERVEVLLLIAAVIAMLARQLRIPYSVGLVLAGITLAVLPFAPDIELTRELIFTAFLPPLVFEAALYLPWRELRKDLPVILTLATLGVLLSAGLTAVGMHYLAGWEWGSAMVFGVLIAATDPVSVIATFKEAGVQGRLRVLVEAESLFNDSTAAVAFGVALVAATGGTISMLGIGQTLVVTVVGGVLCGILVSGSMLLLAGRTDDHLVEVTFTTVAAYGSFLLAEHFHLSGVLASLTAGLLVGNVGSLGSISDSGREAVETFWEYIAFVVNSLIFLLMGMRVAHQPFMTVLAPAVRRHRPGDTRAGRGHLSLLRPLCAFWTAGGTEPSAHLILGWLARCAGPGAGARPTAGSAPPRRNDHDRFCGGRFLGLRARLDHDSTVAPAGKIPSPKPKAAINKS